MNSKAKTRQQGKKGPKELVTNWPEWFKIDNYDLPEDFGLKDWYIQIRRRLPFSSSGLFGALQEILKKQFDVEWKKRLASIREDPLGGALKSDFPGQKDLWNKGGVRIATFQDFLFQYSALFSQHKIKTRFPDPSVTRRPPIIEEWMNDPIANLIEEDSLCFRAKIFQNPLLSINLELPNSLLKASFDTLIARMRLENPWKSIRQIDLLARKEYWKKYSILAYWDLKTWAKETKTKWNRSTMAKALFPDSRSKDGEGGSGWVKDGCERYSKEVFSGGFLDTLLGYIAVDA